MAAHVESRENTVPYSGFAATEGGAPEDLTEGFRILRRNFGSTVMGSGVYSACQWLTMAFLVRLGTPGMVGQFALGLAVSAPIIACTSLQLRVIQASDVRDRFAFSHFLNLRIVGSVVALFATCVVAAVSAWSSETRAVVFVIGLRGVIGSLSDVLYGAMQKVERLDVIARCMALRALAGLLAAVAAMVLFRNVIAMAVASTLGWLIVLCFYERHALTSVFAIPRASKDFLRNAGGLMAIGAPLTVVMFCLSASQSLPRLYLQRYVGEDGLGVFSAVWTLSGGIGMVYLALGQAALPRLSHLHANAGLEFRRTFGNLILFAIGLGACCVIGVYFLGEQVLKIAYGGQFGAYQSLFTGLMICAILNNICVLLGVAATASRNYWPQLGASVMVLAAAMVSAAYLIPAFGMRGALYSGLIIAGVQLVAYSFVYARSMASD